MWLVLRGITGQTGCPSSGDLTERKVKSLACKAKTRTPDCQPFSRFETNFYIAFTGHFVFPVVS
jgi:hypothetical protein